MTDVLDWLVTDMPDWLVATPTVALAMTAVATTRLVNRGRYLLRLLMERTMTLMTLMS